MESAPRLLLLLGGLLVLLQLCMLPGCQAKPSTTLGWLQTSPSPLPEPEPSGPPAIPTNQPTTQWVQWVQGAMSGLEGLLGGQGDPSVMVGQVLAALVAWGERKEWTAEESKILESLNKNLDYEVCGLECVRKEIENTGLAAELNKTNPLSLMDALSNPQQQQQIIDPVLDKVVGSALAVTQACRPTTSACFKCMKACINNGSISTTTSTTTTTMACINNGGGKVAVAGLTILVPLALTFIMF